MRFLQTSLSSIIADGFETKLNSVSNLDRLQDLSFVTDTVMVGQTLFDAVFNLWAGKHMIEQMPSMYSIIILEGI